MYCNKLIYSALPLSHNKLSPKYIRKGASYGVFIVSSNSDLSYALITALMYLMLSYFGPCYNSMELYFYFIRICRIGIIQYTCIYNGNIMQYNHIHPRFILLLLFNTFACMKLFIFTFIFYSCLDCDRNDTKACPGGLCINDTLNCGKNYQL